MSITDTFLRECLLGALPSDVENELVRSGRDASLELIQQHASSIEAQLLRCTKAPLGAAAVPEDSDTTERTSRRDSDITLERKTPITANVCHGCGSTRHFRKDCPHSSDICEHCNRRGHIAEVCRRWIQRDRAGRVKHEVNPTSSKVHMSTTIDRTKQQKMTSAKAVLDEMIDAAVAKSSLQKHRRTKGRDAKMASTDKAPRSGAAPSLPVGMADLSDGVEIELSD